MSGWLISLSLRNRALVIMLTAVMFGVGVYSMRQLTLDAVPDITNVQVQVVTASPALGPLEIEQYITYAVESALSALEMLTRESVGPGDLARHLGVTSAAATGIVDRLVARGHVERQPHEADGRRTQVVLTDSGRAEVIGHLMPMFLALDELDRSLAPDERDVVDRYLTGAIEAIRRIL